MPEASHDQEALLALAKIPEYDWLTDGFTDWWTVAEVATHMALSRDIVRGWCEQGKIAGAVLYGQQVGWRLPRSGLVRYFYELQQQRQGHAS